MRIKLVHVLLVDDHPLFRTAIASVVKSLDQSTTCCELENCKDALETIRDGTHIDLILLDLDLPSMDGLSCLKRIRELTPATPVVIVSASEENSNIREAFSAGARGFIPKTSNTSVILHALNIVLSGEMYLPPHYLFEPTEPTNNDFPRKLEGITPRQHEVLTLLARGHSNKEIARQLDMAENTVRVHVAAILKYLDVKNRTEAVFTAISRGLVPEVE